MPAIQFYPRNEGKIFGSGRYANVTHSVSTIILLIITTLLSTISTKTVKAQISNELAYDSLILGKTPLFGPGFRFVTGTVTPRLERGLRVDTSAENGVELSPEVKWRPLKGDSIERSIAVKLIFSDSLHTEILLEQKDTLLNQDLRLARKTRYKVLKGDNPRFVPRVVVPGATILTGVIAIISLFYVRSI